MKETLLERLDELNQAYYIGRYADNTDKEQATDTLIEGVLNIINVIPLYQEYTKYALFFENEKLNAEKLEDFVFAQFVMEDLTEEEIKEFLNELNLTYKDIDIKEFN